ncbi:restriction endonuclease subunit S [Lactobacillus delbrueckii]|uniref:restriction endonuclease subunit S n=1 Tax=Lactobacillus delbrueckii TaxID=1584 RepID=UPI0006EECCCE|nr:restriction endonuclease subunit S [Lactobacillus delbrueckii]KRL72177.1 type-i specificity determinant subunit [Lactobacillus delbrueckii subsp. indicus DSM 15996]
MADRVTTKNKGMVSELPLTISAQDGLISQDEFFNKKVASKDLSSYLLLHHGDFAYNKSYSNGYPFGTIKRLEKYPQGVVSSLYIAFKPNSRISSDFMAQYYESNNWHKEIYKCATEGARNHGLLNVPPSDFFTTDLNIPIKKSEQLKIGRLLNAVDQTITLHEEKKRQLEHLKSALLQKMFADKSGYPAVRFEGFSNEWEHCKLGNVADITTGSRNHQDSVTDGKYPFFVRSDKVERLNEYDFDTKAILVPGDGRIGEIFHYYNGKFALHQRVYKVDNFNGINELFLLGLFKYSFKEHALRLNAQGTVPSLRLPMFTNWSISVPMITEQERIGVFFQKLDRTISLYDHKLELLKKVKRSMLQAMFI